MLGIFCAFVVASCFFSSKFTFSKNSFRNRVSRKEIILCIKRQSVTGVIIPNVPLLPNTPMGRGMQMIDVTGVMVLSPVTSISVIKHLPLFDTNMVNRHGGNN